MEKNKVLIVDDEPKICSILSALLKKNGYEVGVANCGEAGQVFAVSNLGYRPIGNV